MAISAQQLTIYLYNAHRAVIFAIAQLSCSFNGDHALFHTSKTAKIIKVILLSNTLAFWQGALSNITFIIFAVFDVWNKAWSPL